MKTVDNVKLKYDFSDIEVPASAIEALTGQYDTGKLYGMAKASLGSARSFDLHDITDFFKENIVTTHTRLCCRNLAFVRYLNLRNSTIVDVET